MMRFKQFITEGKYPMLVRPTVGTLVLRINNPTKQIEQEKDPVKQNKLISHQKNFYLTSQVLGSG